MSTLSGWTWTWTCLWLLGSYFTPQRLRDVFWIACLGFIDLRLFHGKLHGLGGVVVTSEFHRVGNPDFCTRSLHQVMSMSNMQPLQDPRVTKSMLRMPNYSCRLISRLTLRQPEAPQTMYLWPFQSSSTPRRPWIGMSISRMQQKVKEVLFGRL